MQCNPIPERDDWFITDRKPTICPRCGKKEVKKAVLGYPTPEDFNNKIIYLIGCIPDMPIDRTWGCRNCDAGFWFFLFGIGKKHLKNIQSLITSKDRPVKVNSYKYDISIFIEF